MFATAKLGNNFGNKGLKTSFIRLGDDGEATNTTDVYVASGTGAPSGAYNLSASDSALYIREDAAGSATVMYVTANGGTAWTVIDPSTVTGASITISDADALQFGTPGTDLVVTANGTDAVVTGTGVLNFVDSLALAFGTGKDITATFDATNLVIAPAVADTGALQLGASGSGMDFQLFGDTVASDVLWDQSADSMIFNDSAKLVFGTGSDISAQFDGTNLVIATAVADTGAVALGADGAGVDVILYGDTASASATWDQSTDSLVLAGVAKIKTQAIADPGTGVAIPVTNSGSIAITTAAAETNTLADPTFMGQWLSIFVDTYAVGDRVITAASRINQAANTIITLGAVGDFIKLEAITIAGALKWQVVSNDGAALS